MKRDFTRETELEILKYIEEVETNEWWKKIGDFFGDCVLHLKHFFSGGAKAVDSEEEWRKYYRDVVDKKNMFAGDLQEIFKLARSVDYEYSKLLKKVREEEGELLLDKLEKLIECANESYEKQVKVAATMDSGIGISDEVLKENPQCMSDLVGDFECATMYSSENVLEMDGLILLAIGLFGWKDIVIDNMVYSNSKDKIVDGFKKDILDGVSGYITVAEIAAQLGISEKDARILIDASSEQEAVNVKRRRNIVSLEETNKIRDKYDELQIILATELKNLINDEKRWAEFSEKYNLRYSQGTAERLNNGVVDGHNIILYKDAIMNVIEGYTGRENVLAEELEPMKKVAEVYQVWYKSHYNEEIPIWELESSQIKKILKSEMGYKKVTEDDVERIKAYGMFYNSIDAAEKGGKALDVIMYLAADYTKELKILDKIERLEGGTPEFELALNQIRQEYSKKVGTLAEQLAEDAIGKGIGVLIKKSPLKIVDFVVEGVGCVTGLSDYASTAEALQNYVNVCSDARNIYSKAIENAKVKNYNYSSMADVRNAFEIMKSTYIAYYDAQIKYEEGFLLGTMAADKNYKDYLEYERIKLQNLQLGEAYEPISYVTYKERFGK